MKHSLMVAMALALTACGLDEKQYSPVPGPVSNDVVVYSCAGQLNLPSKATVSAHHVAYVYGDGSTLAVCSVTGGFFQASNVYLWRAQDDQVVGAECDVELDADGEASHGTFHFSLSRDRANSTVTYLDSGTPSDGSAASVGCTRS